MLYLLVASTLPGVAAPTAGSSSSSAVPRKFNAAAWDQLLAGATIPCGDGYLDSVPHTAVGTMVFDDARQQHITADAFDATAVAYILGIKDAAKKGTRGVWTECFGDRRGTTGVAKPRESPSLRHTIVFETLRVLRALPEPKPLIVYETQLAKAGSAGSQTCSRTYCVTATSRPGVSKDDRLFRQAGAAPARAGACPCVSSLSSLSSARDVSRASVSRPFRVRGWVSECEAVATAPQADVCRVIREARCRACVRPRWFSVCLVFDSSCGACKHWRLKLLER